MLALTAFELVYAGLVLAATYALRGGVGFGGLNVPLLALVLPLKLLAPMIVFLGILSSGAVVARDHRHIAWRRAARVVPACLLGIVLGLYFFVALDAALITRLLGVAVTCYGLHSIWRSMRPEAAPPRQPAAWLTLVMGFGGGFIGTLFGAMAGLFFAIYLRLQNLDKSAFRATSAAMLLVLGVVRALGYLGVGAVTEEVLLACAAALPVMALGVWAGHHIHARLDHRGFDRLVAAVFVLSGVALVVR